jgi:serine/threonine protein kinase
VDEDKGQVLNYFENTFLCQPWRRKLVCILLSNVHVMVLEGHWDKGVVSVVEYLPILLTSEDAVYEIHHAMACELLEGEFPREILDWAPKSHISTFRSSRNATVYKYGDFVLKRLQGEENIQHERSILAKLSETDNVVHLSPKDSGVSPYLVFPNVGLSFEKHRRIDLEIILDVIDTLKSIHDQGILHRDIRPANLILNFNKTKAIVIDFGLAVQLDDYEEFFEGCFVGTSVFAPNDHLNDYSNNGLVYSRATDLESLVKTWVFMGNHCGACGGLYTSGECGVREK